MEFLSRLQNSAFGTWVAESQQVWGYAGILTLHTFGMGLAVGTSWVIDLRVLGVARRVPFAALESVSRAFWIGLAVNAATGVMLFMASAEDKGTQVIFFVKLGLILLALTADTRIRAAVFGGRAARETPTSQGVRLLASASIVLWTAAITAGRLMAYRPAVNLLGYISW
jgi:hypothetical protein